MGKISYHTHTTISDGKVDPEDLIKKALELNFELLAITDHLYMPEDFHDDWGKDFYTDEDYEKLNELKEKYNDKIKVIIGVEFDWLETYKNWIKEQMDKRDYEIKILSVHSLYVGGKYYPLDYSDPEFEEVVSAAGGTQALVKKYYETLREGIKTSWFDMIGHIDIIKIWNKDSKYFDESEEWYVEEIDKTLDLIKEVGLKMEINLAGLRKSCGVQYPSKWIIDKAKERNIEIVIGTDAHKLEELDYEEDKEWK